MDSFLFSEIKNINTLNISYLYLYTHNAAYCQPILPDFLLLLP